MDNLRRAGRPSWRTLIAAQGPYLWRHVHSADGLAKMGGNCAPIYCD